MSKKVAEVVNTVSAIRRSLTVSIPDKTEARHVKVRVLHL